MTENSPRLFTSEAEIERIGEGLLARTLPRPDWTHEAHLAATTYLLLRRTDVDSDKQLPGIIRGYNESVGATLWVLMLIAQSWTIHHDRRSLHRS
ncbi:MAG: hypothetical protein M3428_04920, partial [Pseudomonadota bacterium]|nr:hypothetical protein [Pseudomonadota bacterium]